MTDVIDHTETDVRERILVTAERLFREIGYQKTTVADIAKALRMSSAKCTVSLTPKSRSTQASPAGSWGKWNRRRRLSPRSRTARPQRLRELFETVHRMNSDRYAGDSKMHEMVAAAMEENWDVCKEHIDCAHSA